MKYIAFTIGFLALIGGASANTELDTQRSDAWLILCDEAKSENLVCAGYVRGYIAGIDMYRLMVDEYSLSKVKKVERQISIRLANKVAKKILSGCMPAQVTPRQLTRIWMKYLSETPESHHLLPELTLSQSIVAAFPCD